MQQTISKEVVVTTQEAANTSPRASSYRTSGHSPGGRVVTRISSNTVTRRSPHEHHQHPGPLYYPDDSSMNLADLSSILTRTSASLDQYGIRVPYMPPQSTPMQSFGLPSRHETFGSQLDYNLSWIPKDVQLGELMDSGVLPARLRGLPSKYLQRDPNLAVHTSPSIKSKYLEQSSDVEDSRFLLNQSVLRDRSPPRSPGKSPKRESLIQWFDRTVEKELRKRREGSLNVGENLVNLEPSPNQGENVSRKSVGGPLMLDASSSHIDISARLRSCQDTDLLEAVDKLSKAEAMCAFEGAVRAAEHAAAAAPPEYAEEAAAAGAQEFEAEVTNVVRQEFTGVKPVEVIGYVGITRPKKPKKSQIPS